MSFQPHNFQMPFIPGRQQVGQEISQTPVMPANPEPESTELVKHQDLELAEDEKAFDMMKQLLSILGNPAITQQLDNIPDFLRNKIRWSLLLKDEKAKEYIRGIYKNYVNTQKGE